MKAILQENKSITHVAMVHSETTSGILNDVQSIGRVVKEAGATFIVDAMTALPEWISQLENGGLIALSAVPINAFRVYRVLRM